MDSSEFDRVVKRPTNKKAFIELLTEEITDHRAGNAVRHNLTDILLVGILCIICNGDTFTDMELFGKTHEEELRRYLELPHGIPSHDTFGDVFSRIDPKELGRCFEYFMQSWKDTIKEHRIAIDGKTIRGSRTENRKPKHIVTAFASDVQLVLGQLAVDDKGNEITAIPALLDMFCLRGSTVTIDAIGTQTAIAQKIVDKGGDYVLALKDNQPTLLDDIRFYMENEVLRQDKSALKDHGLYANTLDKGHGRIEKRECFLISDLSWLDGREKWAGLSGAAMIRANRAFPDGTASQSEQYFLFSAPDMTASLLLEIKRGHWAIENQLHWVLDMTFHEDDSRARIENAAEVLDILRKLALQLLKHETSVKASMRAKRLRCAYDLSYAFRCLGFYPLS